MALLRGRLAARLEAPPISVEARIQADPEWQRGADWGEPGPGHPEASVAAHIEEVLANVAREDPVLQPRLRIIALVHDTMKHRVRWWRPDHARLAARFAARYVDDPVVLKIIRRHDDAYRAWRLGARTHLWWLARLRARRLVADLGPALDLFLAFYRCDTRTGDKDLAPLEWFEALVRA
ncbi:MAG: hypothetical protein QOI80_2963 [Solirubrobacteraceae bacterium]|nr:hypothetical protein [Solirubrobacteraceae bacterium]